MSHLATNVVLAAHRLIGEHDANPGSVTDDELAKAQQVLAAVQSPQIGCRYLIKSATTYVDGVIVNINSEWITVMDAVSVIETGAYEDMPNPRKPWKSHDLLPAGPIFVAVGGIIDIYPVPADKVK